jgi:hypothetical protein
MAEIDALERMFQVLVRTLRAKQPALLSAPITVGELYQQILPFRHYRRELQLETNQEYELILMELLSGARGYLDVDDKLRDELSRELHSGSPETARVRDFAESHVSINVLAQKRVTDAPPEPREKRNSGVIRAPSPRADLPSCRYCSGELPDGRALNFCPHCGQNLQVLNCPGCGAEVEFGWKFCVSCGKSVPESMREERVR